MQKRTWQCTGQTSCRHNPATLDSSETQESKKKNSAPKPKLGWLRWLLLKREQALSLVNPEDQSKPIVSLKNWKHWAKTQCSLTKIQFWWVENEHEPEKCYTENKRIILKYESSKWSKEALKTLPFFNCCGNLPGILTPGTFFAFFSPIFVYCVSLIFSTSGLRCGIEIIFLSFSPPPRDSHGVRSSSWGVLFRHTIYTNHPGGKLVHKHKAIKFDVVEERPATKYIQISRKD